MVVNQCGSGVHRVVDVVIVFVITLHTLDIDRVVDAQLTCTCGLNVYSTPTARGGRGINSELSPITDFAPD